MGNEIETIFIVVFCEKRSCVSDHLGDIFEVTKAFAMMHPKLFTKSDPIRHHHATHFHVKSDHRVYVSTLSPEAQCISPIFSFPCLILLCFGPSSYLYFSKMAPKLFRAHVSNPLVHFNFISCFTLSFYYSALPLHCNVCARL